MSFSPSIAGLLSMGHNLRSALLASGLSVGFMAAAGAETRYLREANTPIGRGENSGRTLKESNIVLSLHELGRWNGKPREFEMSVSSLPENVTDIAVLVQSVGQGAILGAVAQPIR